MVIRISTINVREYGWQALLLEERIKRTLDLDDQQSE
jgi:hypothetical protein